MSQEPKIPPVVVCPDPKPEGTKYKVAECIGSGGFAFVYRVIRQPEKTEFAMKVCPHEALDNEKFKAKHFAEIDIQSKLKHPHIVRLEQNWEDANNTYIIMELCRKGSVSSLLKHKGKLTEPETAMIMNQVVDAVKYCHENQVIHRDLKLDNFLISDSNNLVKITDFGISEEVNKKKKDLVFAGTPQYMGPEVVALKEYGFQVDIWAIGVCTFELLTGHRPFDACNMKETYKRISKGEFKFPHELHLSFIAKDFIESALQVKPTTRPRINDLSKHPFLQLAQQYVDSRKLEADKQPTFAVSRYCDQKDELGFLLNDGTCGMLCADGTCMIIDPFCEFIQFYHSSKETTPIVIQMSKVDKTQKPYKKLFKYRDVLTTNEKMFTLPEVHPTPNTTLPFVKNWVRNDHGKLFKLNNNIIQANISSKERVFVDYKNKIMVAFLGSGPGKSFALDETLSSNKEAEALHEKVKLILSTM